MNNSPQGTQGLPRYPTQQVLYDWQKHEQRANLPQGAFYGQCDAYANGDEWIILKADTAADIVGPAALTPNSKELDNSNTRLTKNYVNGNRIIYISNGETTAITEGELIGDQIYIAGLVNRIVDNGAAAAAAGTTYPEFWIELEYPWSKDITASASQYVHTVANQWKSVKEFTAATDKIVAFLPDTIKITKGNAFWGKIAGGIETSVSGSPIKGSALQASGSAGILQPHAAGNQLVAIAESAPVGGKVRATIALGMV